MLEKITLKGRTVTRAHVLAAVRECDRLGRVAFLDRYGYRQASRFHLRVDGRSYPSKAILGRAAGLRSSDFFGGASHTARSLASLGFHVRNSETGELADRKLDSLRRACRRAGLRVGEAWPELPVDVSAYFASGSNRASEIRGLSRAGADVGVAAPEVSPAAEQELHALAGSDVLAFVDSGAFSEVEFGPEGPRVVRPMSSGDWARVLGLYRRLACSLGSSVYVVAPDRVGDQLESLARLERYREEVRELRDLGARILVPIQKGELSQVEFARAAADVLGFADYVPALPCKKAATTAEEVRAFVDGWACSHVHLLGLGVRNRNASAYLAPFVGSRVSVSLDSCWLAGNAGRTNGRENHPHEEKGGPRVYTQARDAARVVLDRTGASVEPSELAAYACLAGSGLVNI